MSELNLISRQARFSSGRRLYNPAWDPGHNQQIYGRDTKPHGNDYVLDAAYLGAIGALDGMIVNLSDLKPALAAAVEPLDGKFLDQDVPLFASRRPTAENITAFLWDALPPQVGGGTLQRLRLQESRTVRVEKTPAKMIAFRSYEFAAAHRLYSPALSGEENWERFDKCSNPAGHGHNYQLEVGIAGEPDPESGYVIPPKILDTIVATEIFERFDHKHLNEDCPEFKDLVPTSENLARTIFIILQTRLHADGWTLARIGLHETQKNYFEVEA